jgi:mono/diheme cytochrome c family protein
LDIMNTMEITKLVGAVCGSLLIFLLIQTAAHAIYNTESEAVAFAVEVAEPTGGDEAPAEEVDVAALVSAADPAAGETVFKKCAACHKLDGANGVGRGLLLFGPDGRARRQLDPGRAVSFPRQSEAVRSRDEDVLRRTA